MRTTLLFLFCLVIACAASSWAQVSVLGGNQVLSITTALQGSEPIAVVNTASTLRYRRQFFVVTKVTVSTSCLSQQFTLKVLATSVTSGTAAPEVTLTNGMPATNFITNIPRFSTAYVTCTLQYTASATFAQGNSTEFGNDVHTVTYTLVRQ